MSTRHKLIKARLGMLALAEELQNISLACKRSDRFVMDGPEPPENPKRHLNTAGIQNAGPSDHLVRLLLGMTAKNY
ncbi:MAG TPA: hypothetical protein VEP50_21125 [bacterium]|nr:hypothetical protein [bacterium]